MEGTAGIAMEVVVGWKVVAAAMEAAFGHNKKRGPDQDDVFMTEYRTKLRFVDFGLSSSARMCVRRFGMRYLK